MCGQNVAASLQKLLQDVFIHREGNSTCIVTHRKTCTTTTLQLWLVFFLFPGAEHVPLS